MMPYWRAKAAKTAGKKAESRLKRAREASLRATIKDEGRMIGSFTQRAIPVESILRNLHNNHRGSLIPALFGDI